MKFRPDRGRLLAEGLDPRAVLRGDAEYPKLLEHLPDPPAELWVAGRRLDRLPPCVSIVGTRTPTGYGQEMAQALASELVQGGLCVVSGMARGIDAWAHAGALEGGFTIAVLAGGYDVCYPSSNRDLYERIVEHGAIVSEKPPGTPTHKRHFTHRNRIIAALSLCTVVVQAGHRSGALTTARHALGIGREVLAVPGDVRVEVSAGVHELLRDGAGLCTSAADVFERIGVELCREAVNQRLGAIPVDLPAEQRTILELLGGETIPAERVGGMAGISGVALATAIVRLELSGWIARAPGGAIRRIR